MENHLQVFIKLDVELSYDPYTPKVIKNRFSDMYMSTQVQNSTIHNSQEEKTDPSPSTAGETNRGRCARWTRQRKEGNPDNRHICQPRTRYAECSRPDAEGPTV